jgi:hypothetical protein
MTMFNDLPKLKKWRAKQLSSSDSTGGNLDYLKAPPHEVVKIGEISGPGCVQRMWRALACLEINRPITTAPLSTG